MVLKPLKIRPPWYSGIAWHEICQARATHITLGLGWYELLSPDKSHVTHPIVWQLIMSGPLQICLFLSKYAGFAHLCKNCFIPVLITNLFLAASHKNYLRTYLLDCCRDAYRPKLGGHEFGPLQPLKAKNCGLLDRDNPAGILLCPPMIDLTACFNMTWFWWNAAGVFSKNIKEVKGKKWGARVEARVISVGSLTMRKIAIHGYG